jgi:hypothetical protein
VQLVILHLRRDKRRSNPEVVNDDTVITRLNIEVHQRTPEDLVRNSPTRFPKGPSPVAVFRAGRIFRRD